MENPTNVAILAGLYNGRKLYIPGVGTGGKPNKVVNIFDSLVGGGSGQGGWSRIEHAYEILVKMYNEELEKERRGEDPDLSVDIFGFSRGSALARAFVNVIKKRGIPVFSSKIIEKVYVPRRGIAEVIKFERIQPEIRFLGIFDTVGSFGVPGNSINIGYDLTVPEEVMFVRHATAYDEKRPAFPLTSIYQSNEEERMRSKMNFLGLGRFIEKPFPGVHSDVGGGYSDQDFLAKVPLEWMHEDATKVGVPFVDIPKEHRSLEVVRPARNGFGPEAYFYSHDSLNALDYFLHYALSRNFPFFNVRSRKIYFSNGDIK